MKINILKNKKLIEAIILFLIVISMLLLSIFVSACDKTCKITFDTQGGSYVREYENSVPSEPTPTRDGYLFKGWYLNKECSGDKIAFPFEAKKNTVLYAKWDLDTRTPIEKFVAAGGKYTAKLDKLYFYFVYDSTTKIINVKSSYDSGLVTFFKFEFNFQIGNVANGSGNITGTDSSSFIIAISKGISNSVTVKCTHISGTDWTSPDVVGLKSNFINKIPTAFKEFYDLCLGNYGLAIY